MFLQHYDMYSYKPNLSAKRNANYYYSDLTMQTRFKKLAIYRKDLAGRGDSGKVIMHSRTSTLLRQKSVSINYHLRLLRLGFVASIQFVPFKNKLITLVFFANGAASYFLTTEEHTLFMFLFLN